MVLPLTGNLDKDRVSLGGKEGNRVSLFWLFVWLEISWFSIWIVGPPCPLPSALRALRIR